jgi:PAS domain S-box-containing protein
LPKKSRPAGAADRDGETGAAALSAAHVAGTTELQRLLLDNVQDYGIFALDTTGHVLSWNLGAQRIKGYQPHEIIGKHFSVFYPRELAAQGFPEFELRTAANTGRFEDEGWRIRKDGSRFWANVVITALRDSDGVLRGFGKVTRDLTERREAEEALRESEERFRLLVEGVKDYAIFMVDPTGRVSTWNSGAERIKGYRAAEIIGRHFSAFYLPEDVSAGKPQMQLDVASRAGRFEEEGWRLRQDGGRFWAGVLITALRNKSGELVGFAKITRDLTERRAAEERALASARKVAAEEAARREVESREAELREMAQQLSQRTRQLEARTRESEEARRRADEANRAKSQFLAAMSHELRTPLNAIGGYTDLLMMGISGPLTPKQNDQLERIRRSQNHLLGIINDILNFSRIEAGQLRYDLGPVDLKDVIASVVPMIAPQADRKQLRVDAAPAAAAAVAFADRAKVEQIVLNLMSNAVKFTDAGSVSIACRVSGDYAIIAVRDTGCGIPSEQLDAIFEPFVQLGRSLTANREGSGLGLAISRDLARAMGGDLTVTSILEVGSDFTLKLPRYGSA